MGGRRKGDVSPARLDREWPHQVMLPGPRVVGRVQGEEIKAFCKGRSAVRGRGRHWLHYYPDGKRR
jgi:hypothetical protein